MEYKSSLKYACETIRIKDNEYDLALETVKDKLDPDQYKYDGEFKVENIYLNASGFCDFCVLIGTKTSKQILHYYRQVEDMCIKMIDDKQEYMITENRKKKEYEHVVNTFLKKNWTYDQEAETNMWKNKYDKDIASRMSEIKLMRKKNLKMQRALDYQIIQNERAHGINSYGICPANIQDNVEWPKYIAKLICDKNKNASWLYGIIKDKDLDYIYYPSEGLYDKTNDLPE